MRKEASLSIIEDVENHKFLMIRHHRGINKGCVNFLGGKRKTGKRWRIASGGRLLRKQVW